MNDLRKKYGRDGLMITAAVRYCLGRQTYIVSDCCDWIIANWHEWPNNVKASIKRDVEEAFEKDEEMPEYKFLGDACDKQAWEKVRNLWSLR